MGYIFDTANSQYLSVTVSAVTYPFTFGCWVWIADNTQNNNVAMSVVNKLAGRNRFAFNAFTDGKLYLVAQGDTTSETTHSLAIASATWTPVIAVIHSASDRDFYVGAGSSNNTTNVGAIGSMTTCLVGAQWNAGGTAADELFKGKVACPFLALGEEYGTVARAAYIAGTEGHKIAGTTPDLYKDLIRNLSTPSDFGSAFTASGSPSPSATDHPPLLTGQNKKQITLTGTHIALGETIQTVVYDPDPGYDGSDSLTILTTDATALTDTDSTALTIAAPPPGQPWTQWELNPTNPIVYEHSPIDIGAIISFTPVVNFTGQGTATIFEAHSDTDSGYSSFVDITAGSGEITGRWIKIKVSVADAFARFDGLEIIITADVISEDLSDIDTSTLSGSAGSRRLVLQKSYSLIKTVAPILQDVGDGWSINVADRNPTLGPLIKIYDGATPTDATIDVVVRGIA
jgi:hypothetical protein